MIFVFLLLINLALILSSPKFAITEDDIIIYLSSHGYYQIVPDEFTLTYLSGLSVNNLTRISSNVLKQYDRLTDITSSTILRNWDDATDRISSKLKLIQDEPDLIANHILIGAICNPSVIYFHGRYLVAGRRTDWKPLVVFAWLRSDFAMDSEKYLGIGPGLNKIDNNGINDFGEDPRLVVVDKDTFLMIRTDSSSRPFRMRLSYIKYENDNNIEKLVQLNDTILLPPNFELMPNASQKNWSPFYYKSQLMFVYQLHDSLTVIRQKPNKLGNTEVVSEVSNNGRVSNLWEYGQIRGGSPARRIGNSRYLSFFHSQLPTVGTGMYWHSMYMGAYIFSGAAPFKLLSLSRVPIYYDGWFTGPWMKAYQTLYVYFAVNFYFIDIRTGNILEHIDEEECELECMENYNVSLSYGFNDGQGYVGIMNLAKLFQTLHHFDSGDIKNDFLKFPSSNDFHFDAHTKLISSNHTEKLVNSYARDQCGIQNQHSVITDIKSLITDGMSIVETSSLLPVHFKVVTRDKPADIVKWIDDDIAHYDLISWHFKWLEEHLSKQEHEKRTFHCMDMGGNHGFYSYYLAKHNCTVEMFEVQLDLVEVDRAAVHVNNLHDKVLIHNLGLSDKDSKMHINGVGGIAFLTPDPTSTSYTVNVTSADKCLYHRAKHYAFVKIDVEGFEVRALHGFNWTISNSVVEAFLIEIGPNRWNRADISVEEGSNMMLSILSSHFLCYIVIRNADSCPTSVYPSTSEYDILLSGASILKRVPWNKFTDLMVAMAKDDYDCNFFVLHHTHSLVQRLEMVPYKNNIEGKFIRGSSGRAIYLFEGGKLRDIPNMDTLEKLQQTAISKDILVISNSKISALPVGLPIPPV